MPTPTSTKQPVQLLKYSWNILISHPVIFYPFCFVAFLQLFTLEIFYFAPRYPLNVFFGPIILKLMGPLYMHYPFTYGLLAKWFQAVQPWLYILVHSFYMGAAIDIINRINDDRPIELGRVFKDTMKCYVYLFVVALMLVSLVWGLSFAYDKFFVNRLTPLPEVLSGWGYAKWAVVQGSPFIKLFINILVTALFAFTYPAIIIDREKVLTALIRNIQYVMRSFWSILLVISLMSVLYVPVMMLMTNSHIFEKTHPDVWGGVLISHIFVVLLVEAIQVTTLTVYYLLLKGE